MNDPLLLDHLLFVLVAIAWPVYGLLTYPKLKRELAAGVAGRRLYAYRETLVIEWGLALAALLLWIFSGRPLAGLGLRVEHGIGFYSASLLVMLAVLFLHRQWQSVRKLGGVELGELAGQFASVQELMPRSRTEYRTFIGLAITAGLCEELLFRGLLIWYLSLYLGPWPALILSVLLFGAAHLYQGPKNALRCAAIGLVAALLYVWSGSLLPPMLLHVAVDLHGGAIGHLVLRAAEKRAATAS